MSYFYIINPEAGRGSYRKIAMKLKQTLLDLDIAGEFAVATPADNFCDLAHLGLKRGYKNIIAVGGSETVNKVALALIQSQRGVFGIIPIGTANRFAKLLGIKNWEHGCEILAARRINRIDAGAADFVARGRDLLDAGVAVTGRSSSLPGQRPDQAENRQSQANPQHNKDDILPHTNEF